jgi:hypothetical protein
LNYVSLRLFKLPICSNVGTTPIFAATQAQGQAAQNNYNQQVATQNQNTAGLYSLAGTAASGGMYGYMKRPPVGGAVT